MDRPPPAIPGLRDRIEASLDDSERPICVHGLYETVKEADPAARRDDLLESVRTEAVALVHEGHAQHAYVSAIAIGAHCEDEVFWSSRLPHQRLEDFGPEFEQLAIARRLAAHFECHGL